MFLLHIVFCCGHDDIITCFYAICYNLGIDMWLKRIKEFILKYYYVGIIIFAVILKVTLTANLPLYARDSGGADEYLMMYQAEQLASGNYLGPYNYLTLVKGIGFPVFLSLSYKLGIPLLVMYSLFYVTVCLIALIPIRRMIKQRPLQLLVFLILLFCPATMDTNVQMVYRNMLIIPQSVLLVSALMMMFYHVNGSKKKLVLWSMVTSFAWIFMWHTREDTIWSVPLIAIAWIVMVVAIVKKRKRHVFASQVTGRVLIISLPVVLLILSSHIISFINYRHYGIYTTNQLNYSNYTKAFSQMIKIKPEKEIDRVEITHETIRRLYELSPTFRQLEPIIEKDYKSEHGLVTAWEENGEINEDLITWELTGAASLAGYYKDAQTAENFWNTVYEELKQAIDDGKVETRSVMPSRSMIPYPNQPDSLDRYLSAVDDLFERAATYYCSTINVDVTAVDEETTRRYEAITGGYAVREGVGGKEVDPLELRASRWVGYANKIRRVYSIASPVLFVMGVIYYVVLTIIMVILAIKKKECYFDRWLLLSATLGSTTMMILGFAYVEAFMFVTFGYLASCSGVFNMFVAITTGLILQGGIRLFKHGVLRWRKRCQ